MNEKEKSKTSDKIYYVNFMDRAYFSGLPVCTSDVAVPYRNNRVRNCFFLQDVSQPRLR